MPQREDQSKEAHNHKGRPEEHAFDELARRMASGAMPRGQALKLVGGALLGGLLASIPGAALAKKKHSRTASAAAKKPSKCNKDKKCPSGESCCSGTCTNLQTDTNNCGSCGHACASGEGCCSGT